MAAQLQILILSPVGCVIQFLRLEEVISEFYFPATYVIVIIGTC